jgi:hypothetical protein
MHYCTEYLSVYPGDTHIQRQVALHDCLPGLLADRDT